MPDFGFDPLNIVDVWNVASAINALEAGSPVRRAAGFLFPSGVPRVSGSCPASRTQIRSWFWKQGDDHLVIMGSCSLESQARDLTYGYLLDPLQPPEPALVQSPGALALNSMRVMFPDGVSGDGKIFFAGYSLGGACAFASAAIISRLFPRREISYALLNPPKHCAPGYWRNCGQAVGLRWHCQGDVIGHCPSNTADLGAAAAVLPQAVQDLANRWMQPGYGFELKDDGSIQALGLNVTCSAEGWVAANQFGWANDILRQPILRHSIAELATRLARLASILPVGAILANLPGGRIPAANDGEQAPPPPAPREITNPAGEAGRERGRAREAAAEVVGGAFGGGIILAGKPLRKPYYADRVAGQWGVYHEGILLFTEPGKRAAKKRAGSCNAVVRDAVRADYRDADQTGSSFTWEIGR